MTIIEKETLRQSDFLKDSHPRNPKIPLHPVCSIQPNKFERLYYFLLIF